MKLNKYTVDEILGQILENQKALLGWMFAEHLQLKQRDAAEICFNRLCATRDLLKGMADSKPPKGPELDRMPECKWGILGPFARWLMRGASNEQT